MGFALALPDINQALKPAGGRLFPTGLFKILYYQRLIKKCAGAGAGRGGGVPRLGAGGGFYATLMRNARKLGYGDLRNVLDIGRQRTDEPVPEA